MAFFNKFIVNLLPDYFHRADTNKDSNEEGTLNRYLQVLGEDLDAEVLPYLEDITDIIDIETTPAEFINYIAYTLGNPPDIFKDEALYRKVLRYVLNVYKIKGTKASYELYFSMLGYNVTLTELAPSSADLYDDPASLYDDADVLYDDGCKACSEYEIVFTAKSNPLAPLPPQTLQQLRDIIHFVEPINAKLKSINLGISVNEDVNFCLEQDIKMETLAFLRYDDPAVQYDALNSNYDDSVTQTVLTLPINCQGLNPTEGISVWELENDFEVQ